MTTLLALGAVILVLVLAAANMASSILPFFGNELSQKFGLQDTRPVGIEYLGRKVKILGVDSEGVRVEVDGSSWKATTVPADYVPDVGEWVVIKKVDGLTFQVGRDA